MRPAILLSAAVVIALACAPALQGCGGGAKHSIRVGPMPAGGSFTGVWFSPQYGEMHIEQSGSTAIGRYTKDERQGRLQGSVEGDVLRFEWKEKREMVVGRPAESKGHGYFKVYKKEDEDTWNLQGEWGTDASETGGGPWTAVKSKARQPDVAGDGSGGSSSGSGSGSGSGGDFGGTDVGSGSGSSGSGGGGSDDLSDL
jgi:hypothetical protein